MRRRRRRDLVTVNYCEMSVEVGRDGMPLGVLKTRLRGWNRSRAILLDEVSGGSMAMMHDYMKTNAQIRNVCSKRD